MPMPSFLDLVPEQHPLLFPRKKDPKTGRPVNTSKTEWRRAVERTVVRAPGDIDGITIHQTACVFGPADRDKAHRRALRVPAHVVAFRDGTYVQGAPLLWFLYHGNALNGHTLGLECEGHYPGLLDDPTTPRREDEDSLWGRDATPVTPEALLCFRAALRHLVEGGRALGCPIKYIWAHRQSSESRRSDPGQELWTMVAEWGCRELGLKARYADVFGGEGRPIPREWSAKGGVGRY